MGMETLAAALLLFLLTVLFASGRPVTRIVTAAPTTVLWPQWTLTGKNGRDAGIRTSDPLTPGAYPTRAVVTICCVTTAGAHFFTSRAGPMGPR
jgi:hypothetical protein